MEHVERDIVVQAPVRTVYNQWTQFEEFPRFMEGVEEVRQLDDQRLLWRASIGGREAEWEAQIEEQVPDQKIAWRSTGGRAIAGRVTFRQESTDQTRVHLEMDYEPEGATESIGEALGMVERRVEGDLERFKEFIEERGQETGGWRGEIHGSEANREQALGEQRQGMPGAGEGAPGGQGRVDPNTGRFENP